MIDTNQPPGKPPDDLTTVLICAMLTVILVIIGFRIYGYRTGTIKEKSYEPSKERVIPEQYSVPTASPTPYPLDPN